MRFFKPKQQPDSKKTKEKPRTKQELQEESHARTDQSILSGSHLDEVLSEANSRLAQYEQAGDKVKQCVILNKLGLIYKAKKQMPEAVEVMQKSLELAEELKNLTVEAIILRNLGTLYLLTNQHVKALRCHEESLRIKRELGDRLGEAGAEEVLSNGFEDRGDFNKAIEHAKKALFIYDSLGDAANSRRIEDEIDRLEDVASEIMNEEYEEFQYIKSNRIHTVDIFHAKDFKEELEI